MDVRGLEEYEYAPVWRGNRDLPVEEQIVVVIGAVSARERMKCMQTVVDLEGNVQMIPDFAEYTRYGVKSIRNLTVNGKIITTAEALLSSSGEGLDNLVRDLGSEVYVSTQKGPSKN